MTTNLREPPGEELSCLSLSPTCLSHEPFLLNHIGTVFWCEGFNIMYPH